MLEAVKWTKLRARPETYQNVTEGGKEPFHRAWLTAVATGDNSEWRELSKAPEGKGTMFED